MILEVDENEINLVMTALAKLPLEHSFNLFTKINMQVQQQLKQEVKSQPKITAQERKRMKEEAYKEANKPG